jgi:serine/threonine protein kinase
MTHPNKLQINQNKQTSKYIQFLVDCRLLKLPNFHPTVGISILMLQYTCLGDRGPSHAKLDWPAHLKIVQGIAQGMDYLHTQLNPSNIPHGNLKSSNILLSPNYDPLLSDYGSSTLIRPANAAQAFFSYKAPEAIFILEILIPEIVIGGNHHSRRLRSVKVFHIAKISFI